MMYVLNSVNYTGSTIADQKVQSLGNYSNFQEIKTFATTNIPTSSLRALSSAVKKRSEFRCGTKHNERNELLYCKHTFLFSSFVFRNA